MSRNIQHLIVKNHLAFDKCMVPPSKDVIEVLRNEFYKSGEKDLGKFLKNNGLEPGLNPLGKDDSVRPNIDAVKSGIIEMERINVPDFKPVGETSILVLLIDFEDNKSSVSHDHYTELLFSKNTFETGSLRDYYDTVSKGKVNIVGQISGWHRMPEKYSFYVGNGSGGDGAGYPHNARRMVEDAVKVAMEKDAAINWDKYDLNGDGMIDGLYVVHAGPGAEVQQTAADRQKHIWSHKWVVQNPVKVSNKTSATIYLTVPDDGRLGVYAHETGHLLFGWPDLYDACDTIDRTAGIGDWSLMAGGSWNGDPQGTTPAYPDGFCRMVQGWSSVTTVDSNIDVTMTPIEDSDKIVTIPIKGKLNEYFILESRKKLKYDKFLPGEGVLIYHIDEQAENNCEEKHLAVGVIQADGQQDMQRIGFLANQGDDGDPFPGKSNRTNLDSNGFPNTRDYDNKDTKIKITGITWNGNEGHASIKIE